MEHKSTTWAEPWKVGVLICRFEVKSIPGHEDMNKGQAVGDHV